jgi:hypothetical protein
LGNPGENVLRKVAAVAAKELHWDGNKVEQEIKAAVDLLQIPQD